LPAQGSRGHGRKQAGQRRNWCPARQGGKQSQRHGSRSGWRASAGQKHRQRYSHHCHTLQACRSTINSQSWLILSFLDYYELSSRRDTWPFWWLGEQDTLAAILRTSYVVKATT